MAKKSSTKKSLKGLFSKSEASLEGSVEKDAGKNEGEKKRFKFPKLKLKSKNSSAPEKSAGESQQVLSAVEPSNTAEDKHSLADNVVSGNKQSFLYGTAPRAKGKEFSYSELDLRKPKRFATFSFGLKKKRKKDEENISKSSFGLHRPGIEEQEETPLDLGQMELDQPNTKTMFSKSQPELDSSSTFNIPGPPPVATNQSESDITLPNQSESVFINTQPEPKEPLTNGFDLLDGDIDTLQAPIASIPELQLDYPASAEENENISVHGNSSKSDAKSTVTTTHAETTSVVDPLVAPSLPPSQPPVLLDTSDHKAATVDSVSTSNNPGDNVILQQSDKKNESTTVTLSHHRPDDTADSTISNSESSLPNVGSKTDTTVTQSTPLPHTDKSALSADFANIHQEISAPHTERSVPEAAKSVTTTSVVKSKKTFRPVNEDVVYGALYDSLFPQSFTAEIMSSLSNPSPQIRTEIRHIDTRTEPVMVKTLNECHSETNTIHSVLSTSRDFDSAARRMDDTGGGFASLSGRNVISSSESSTFTSYQTPTTSQFQRNPEIHHRYRLSSVNSSSKPADSDNIPYSEMTRSHLEVKSDSRSLIHNTVRPVPVFQNSAPPATSQGTDTQVTDSKRRGILVKELVTDEASADPGRPSPKMSAVKGVEIRIKTTESFSEQTDRYDGALSPAYLSVGSDDSSAVEIYYSAEEDNAEESGADEMFTMDEREESYVVDSGKEEWLREVLPQQEESSEGGISRRDEGDSRVVIIKMEREGGNEEERVDFNSRTEAEQRLRGQKSKDQVQEIRTSEFLVFNDAESQIKGETTAQPQMEEEGDESDWLREELPQKEETSEGGISQRDEAELKVVIIKMEREGSNEEEREDFHSCTEVEQRLRGQKSEDQVQRIERSEFLVGNDAESREKEGATTAWTQMEEEERERTFVIHSDKEDGLRDKLPEEEETSEGGICQRDEAELKVVIIKMEREGGNEEEREDFESCTKVEQRLRVQKSEDQVQRIERSEFLVGNDAESREKEGATTAWTQMEEEEREETVVIHSDKEDGLCDDGRTSPLLPEEEETSEGRICQRDEAELKVVIIKMEHEGGNEEEREDFDSRTEVEQRLRGQKSEDQVQRIERSEFLVGNDAESREKEGATTAWTQMEEEEREETFVVDDGKELPQHEEASEGEISRKDEGDLRVANIKMGCEVGNEEEREDFNSRTEAEQQLRGQQSKDQVQRIERSEFLVGNDAESQEKGTTPAQSQKEEEGEERRKEELVATPVQQVSTPMVCDLAPPSSELRGQGEGSEGNWTVDVETEDHCNGEKQIPSQEGQYLANKDTRSSDSIHASSSNTREEDVITPTVSEAEEQVSLTAGADRRGEASKEGIETSSNTTISSLTDTSGAAEVVTGNLTHGTKLQSDAAEIEHNRAQRDSEWADTITQSPDRSCTVQEQVAVELSNQSADTHRPDSEPAEGLSGSLEHPAEAQPDLNEGFLTASTTAAAASESHQKEGDQESADKMYSGFSSLSTKLTIRSSSPPKEDESKLRFHKVSLIREDDTTDVRQDTVDFDRTRTSVTESNGTDLDSEYKWKNRFEGVTQYNPNVTENSSFSDSLSYRMSDSYSSNYSNSSSALSESTAYKHSSNAFSSSPSPEEHITLGKRRSDRTEIYLSREREPVGEPKDEWRRSLLEREEPAAPAGEREGQREAESERIRSRWDSQLLPASGFSLTEQTSYDTTDSLKDDNDEASRFTGVFKATLVELVPDPVAPPPTPPASPDADSPNQFDMESLVDTLRNMGPSLRPRTKGLRAPPQVLVSSSLPPIVEDAPSPIPSDVPDSISLTKKMEPTGTPAESLNGLYTLPVDLGLKRSTPRDTRSPLELMKQSQEQQQSGTRGLTLPLRASATSSIVMKSSDSSPEDLQSAVLNGNGVLPSSTTGSRLDNSIIFSSYRSSSIDQPQENGKAHRPIFRTSSLPESGLSNNRMSTALKESGDLSTGADPVGTRFERFSFLSSSSLSGSVTGAEDFNSRMSRPPTLSISTPPSSNSPTCLLSPTGSIELQRPFPTSDSPLSLFSQTPGMGMGVGTGTLGTPILQRSFSSEGPVGVQTSLFSNVHGGPQFQSQEPDRNLMSKYRAFPDAYLTKEKEHGKLNPRPGKMYIFDRPGMCGQRIEIRSDVVDATPWELEETISIRVVRGGWVLYEKPNFKGEKIALDEGDIELTYPFSPPEEQVQKGQKEGEQQNAETSDEQAETKPARRFIIGSVRRAVRDYSVPEISLFPEENAEGKKVIFRDTSDDARIFGFPVKANSIIINAGLWLVYAQPFFQGVPRVLEVGGYSNPAAWGVEHPYVGSLHPLKVGEPRVENLNEPKMVIYDKAYFTGKSRTITMTMRDFMTRTDRQQTAFMYNVGSLKVLGGIWVGYEKEGFRGHQYLLEEGEYHDWRVWGGCDAELRSVRVIRADLTDPMMVMFEQPEEDQEGMQEENTFEVTEAIPDVELFGYKTSTRSIQVLSGAWIAYSHVDFSGNQYILEKGFYNNCADWGSQDTRICSVQPILLAPTDNSKIRNEILLYSEPDFQGECHVFDHNQEAIPEKLLTKSCRVGGGSWVLYESKQYSGNLYVLSEGDYPNLTSMGCPPETTIRSIKTVPMLFSVPSISLFGLECLEGREITTETEVVSMVEEGFNNHILSLRVNSGCWVICEHSNYRGRQFLLEPIEITNWPKFSSLHTIGSMYPVKQKRHFFRVKNKERGHFLSVQGGVEEMKSGRVVVTPEVEPMSEIWFYQDGFIKNKMCPTMSLQVMGNIEPAAKVVLWTETRQPIQTWRAHMEGLIMSLTFPGMVLDVKGGKTYDKDHVVIMPENDERTSQQWEIELL